MGIHFGWKSKKKLPSNKMHPLRLKSFLGKKCSSHTGNYGKLFVLICIVIGCCQVLRLFHFLVKFGYYGSDDIKALLKPLISLLNGKNDKPFLPDSEKAGGKDRNSRGENRRGSRTSVSRMIASLTGEGGPSFFAPEFLPLKTLGWKVPKFERWGSGTPPFYPVFCPARKKSKRTRPCRSERNRKEPIPLSWFWELFFHGDS